VAVAAVVSVAVEEAVVAADGEEKVAEAVVAEGGVSTSV
jgi:hypothetical protein